MSDSGIKVAKSHTLGLEQLAIIASHAKHAGLNESAALRQIISEWKERQFHFAVGLPPLYILLDAVRNLENDDGAIPSHAWDALQDAIKAYTPAPPSIALAGSARVEAAND